MQKMSAALVTLSLAMSLSGCWEAKGPGPAPGGTEPVLDSGAQASMRIMWWGSPARYDATIRALQWYEKKHPKVRFEPETTNFEQYENRLTTLQAAGSLPDLIQLDAAWLKDWMKSGSLAELPPRLASGIDTTLRESGIHDNKLYAIPLGVTAFGFIYNKTAFQELGIPEPQPNWTWDEFQSALLNMKKHLAPGQYVFQDMTVLPNMYEAYQLSKGLPWPRAQGQFKYDKDTWLEWITMTSEWRKNGISAPPELTVSDRSFEEGLDLFLSGKVLMKALHSSEMPAYESLRPGTMGVVSIPVDQRGGGWIKASMYWAVRADSPHKEEASRFIEWFVQDVQAGEILGTTRGLPVSSSVRAKLEPGWSRPDRLAASIVRMTEPRAPAFDSGPGLSGAWLKFDREYRNLLREIMFNRISAEQAWARMEAMAKEW